MQILANEERSTLFRAITRIASFLYVEERNIDVPPS